ncbi:PE-PGRS family protein [Naasia lichenicola]|uniref:PE-PGRS family protein n=1 Tax=Naasia lichenicola TaxID=2565933 RepID=A0A4S4FF91_9MICO|nr:PE-PGRS family protein [Naasia lichenicola]
MWIGAGAGAGARGSGLRGRGAGGSGGLPRIDREGRDGDGPAEEGA